MTMFRAGRSRGAGIARSGDALSAERRFLVELENDVATPTEPVGPTVGEFLVEWLVASEPTRRPTTSVSYERCVRDHVIPHLGQVRLRDLAPEHVRSWQAVLLRTPRRFRDGPLSTTTVRYCHRLLRRALQDALRWELVDRNVCDAVVAPRRADTEMSVWSPPDVRRFLAFVADDRLVAMWRLFLVTGMRRGEIAGLRWIDVDLDAGRLSVRHTRVLVYSAAQVSEPKTKRSRRVIALDAGTVDALREHRTRQGAERELAQDVWVESGYVFVREDGTPMDPDRISHLFRVSVAAAGLPTIRLHDLRTSARDVCTSQMCRRICRVRGRLCAYQKDKPLPGGIHHNPTHLHRFRSRRDARHLAINRLCVYPPRRDPVTHARSTRGRLQDGIRRTARVAHASNGERSG